MAKLLFEVDNKQCYYFSWSIKFYCFEETTKNTSAKPALSKQGLGKTCTKHTAKMGFPPMGTYLGFKLSAISHSQKFAGRMKSAETGLCLQDWLPVSLDFILPAIFEALKWQFLSLVMATPVFIQGH